MHGSGCAIHKIVAGVETNAADVTFGLASAVVEAERRLHHAGSMS